MKLTQRYSEILDASMEKSFPDWTNLTALDPVKLIVAGMAGSLSSVEVRQTKLAEQMLALTPTLMGFSRKPPQLSAHLFQLSADDRDQSFLKFQNPPRVTMKDKETACEVQLDARTRWQPIVLKSWKVTAGKRLRLEIVLEIMKPLREVQLFWLSDQNQINSRATACRNTGVDVNVTDDTQGLQTSGFIVLNLQGNRSAEFSGGTHSFVLEWDSTAGPVGELLNNVCVGTLVHHSEWLSIGNLRGEAWEEIFLPEELVQIPSEVLLCLPTGNHNVVTRAEDEALRSLMFSTPNLSGALTNSFIYNSIRHSVTFPEAHVLTGVNAGGLALVVRAGLFDVPGPRFLEPAVIQTNGNRFSLHYIKQVRPPELRETAEAFSRRFHERVRLFFTEKGAQPEREIYLSPPDELRSKVINCDERIRLVEVHEHKQGPNVYVGTSEDRAAPLSADLQKKIERHLAVWIPLDKTWTCRSFTDQALTLKFSFDGERPANIEFLKQTCERVLKETEMDDGRDFKLSTERCLARIRMIMPDLGSANLTALDPASGNYLALINRGPGRIFRLEIEC